MKKVKFDKKLFGIHLKTLEAKLQKESSESSLSFSADEMSLLLQKFITISVVLFENLFIFSCLCHFDEK